MYIEAKQNCAKIEGVVCRVVCVPPLEAKSGAGAEATDKDLLSTLDMGATPPHPTSPKYYRSSNGGKLMIKSLKFH